REPERCARTRPPHIGLDRARPRRRSLSRWDRRAHRRHPAELTPGRPGRPPRPTLACASALLDRGGARHPSLTEGGVRLHHRPAPRIVLDSTDETVMETTALELRSHRTLRDLIALTKPRITLMVVITAAGGAYLSPARLEPFRMAILLLTMSMIVGGANALNCYLERDSDRFMARTASRPLPSGRLAPSWGLVVGLGLGLSSLPLPAYFVNGLTAVLDAVALVSYVAIYTPMKQASPTALLVGAVPGALPPLMGWTGATGSLDAPGFVLFGILFLWQIPHFLAISVFRQEE